MKSILRNGCACMAEKVIGVVTQDFADRIDGHLCSVFEALLISRRTGIHNHMPHASHRLDLLVVAFSPDQAIDHARVQALFDEWGVDELGRTSNQNEVVTGGCVRIWLDDPGRLVLYANQSGGFRVFCPSCAANTSSSFGAAHRAWKQGGERRFRCSTCQCSHKLEDARIQPPGAFSSWAIVFADVTGTDLTEAAKASLQHVIGDYRVVLRRP